MTTGLEPANNTSAHTFDCTNLISWEYKDIAPDLIVEPLEATYLEKINLSVKEGDPLGRTEFIYGNSLGWKSEKASDIEF